MEGHKGVFNLETMAVSSVHPQVNNEHAQITVTVLYVYCCFFCCVHKKTNHQITLRRSETPGPSPALLYCICFCDSFVSLSPVSLCRFLNHSASSVILSSVLSVFTRITTWSVSSNSVMHWRGERRSHCELGRKRFQRTNWNTS